MRFNFRKCLLRNTATEESNSVTTRIFSGGRHNQYQLVIVTKGFVKLEASLYRYGILVDTFTNKPDPYDILCFIYDRNFYVYRGVLMMCECTGTYLFNPFNGKIIKRKYMYHCAKAAKILFLHAKLKKLIKF